VTINHAVSMTIPALGGWLWEASGHRWVFVVAAGIAVAMMAFASRVRVGSHPTISPAGS
jgi:hypothetical protein